LSKYERLSEWAINIKEIKIYLSAEVDSFFPVIGIDPSAHFQVYFLNGDWRGETFSMANSGAPAVWDYSPFSNSIYFKVEI
jgi:hypothetical protein